MIKKIKLSVIMLDWNIRGWIDNSSPIWFRILFWVIYHTIHKDRFELEHS